MLTQQQSSSASLSQSGSWTESFSGTNLFQGPASYSGTASGGFSDSYNVNASGSLSMQGNYANGSVSLTNFSYSGSGNDSTSAQQNQSSSWSGAYSGSDNANASGTGNGSWSVSLAGNLSGGSFSLASDILQSSSSGNYSTSESNQESSSGGAFTTSLRRSGSGGESDDFYQSGKVTGGTYSNLSYSVSSNESDMLTTASSAPSYVANDTWQDSNSLSVTGSGTTGTESESSTTTYSWLNYPAHQSQDSGLGTSSFQTVISGLALPQGVMPPPLDAASVPRDGAEWSAGMAPVPASPDVALVPTSAEWMSSQGQYAGEVGNNAVYFASNQVPQANQRADNPVAAPAGPMPTSVCGLTNLADASGDSGDANAQLVPIASTDSPEVMQATSTPPPPAPPPPADSGVLSGLWNSISNTASAAWDEASRMASYVINNPSEAVQQASQGVEQGANALSDMWKGFKAGLREEPNFEGTALGDFLNEHPLIGGTVDTFLALKQAQINLLIDSIEDPTGQQRFARAFERGVQAAQAAYESGQENLLGAAVLGELLMLADATGVTNLNEALTGKELFSNRQLSAREIVSKAEMAGIQLAETGVAVYGMASLGGEILGGGGGAAGESTAGRLVAQEGEVAGAATGEGSTTTPGVGGLREPTPTPNTNIKPATPKNPARPGRPGSPAHIEDVARNNAQQTGQLQPETIKIPEGGYKDTRVPDGVGQPGQAVTIRGQTIDPGPNGRVIVESENFRNGRPVSKGREQILDIRRAEPDATIVVTDPKNVNAPPLVYPPGTQPPPPGWLPKNTPPIVPSPES